jgi:hypothetical protein
VPPSPPPAVPAGGRREGSPRLAIGLLLAAAACLVVGTFLPWASVQAPVFGTLSWNGFGGDIYSIGINDVIVLQSPTIISDTAGTLTLACGLAVLVLACLRWRRWAVLPGATALVVAGWVLWSIADWFAATLGRSGVGSSPIVPSFGLGPWFLLLGSLLTLGGSYAAPRRRNPATLDQLPPPDTQRTLLHGWHRKMLLAACVVALLLLGVLLFVWLRRPAFPVEWYTADAIPAVGGMPGQSLTEAGRALNMTYVAVEAQVPAKFLDAELARLLESYERFDSSEPGGGSLGDSFRLDAPDTAYAPMMVRLSLHRPNPKGVLKVTAFYLTSRQNAESGRLEFHCAKQRPVRLTAGIRRADGRSQPSP